MYMHVCRCRQDGFLNFSWRPRPPCQLTPEKEREVAKNLKTYGKKFEEQDEILLQAADVATTQRRARQRLEWETLMQNKQVCCRDNCIFAHHSDCT